MDTNLCDALSGLLLLRSDSNNDSDDHFYHDAMSQLTHDTTAEWMMKTKIPDENTVVYKRWIKPENGLDDSFGPRWKQRPIGNSPKLMPLDNLLN